LKKYNCQSVIHFAGLKAVGESVSEPLAYYDVNVSGTVKLLQAMTACGVKSFVFSSSATVYGNPQQLPIPETHPLSATNPYGWTKLVVEQILRDLHAADQTWAIAILRYFNPVGAHESGLIGEDPNGIPNNLMPLIANVGSGRLDKLRVFGGDYPTHDGTGVRDFIHVVDLAEGHIKALKQLSRNPQCLTVNLGTGVGYSVLDLVKEFRLVSNRKIPYEIVERRPGDVAASFADPSKAERVLGWKAARTLRDMCADTWNWQIKYPEGYG
jgi:UDP-glucose 4-epimerase